MKLLNTILEKLRNKYNKETKNGLGIYIMKELTSTITCSTLFMTSKEYIDNDLLDCDPNVLDICTFGLEPSKILSNTSLNSISDNKSLIIHEHMTINSDNRIIRSISPSNSTSRILTTTDICKYNISYDDLDMNLLEIIPNLDKLELLYKEIHNSLNKNLSIQAYSLFIKLTYLLLEVLEKLEYIGYKVKIEMELLINNGEKICNEVSNNTQSQQGTHSFLKRIQNRNNLNSISNNKNMIELVELTQSGIPFKNINNNYQHNNSKRWHINQKSPDNNINTNTNKSKIYLEPYPLFPKISNKKKRSCELNLESSSNYNFDTSSRFYKLEEFPCIIFSYNCQSIYNKCFADSSHRNLALEYIKFPTKVNCIGLGNNNPLANFIRQIVTDMHLHRLRFTIFKCSESYRGLISALRIRQSYSKTNNNEQKYHFLQNKSNNSNEISDDESDIYNELYKGNQYPEWNTLDDSNIGMWWAIDSNSEFRVLCDFTVDTNVLNVISLVNESNFHSHWAPFVTNSECISYIGLYSQLISHSSSLPWPIGLCQCSLYCVAVDICRSPNNQPCVIITAISFPDKADSACGIKTKDQPNNASKLDILSLCFVIQPFEGNNLKTRISFISKSLIPISLFVPKAVPSFIAKQIGKCLFNNLMRIIRNFESSPFYKRILDDIEFYEFVRNRLNINSEAGVINNIDNPIFDINLNYKEDMNYFNKDKDQSYLSVTMNILHTSYSMETLDEDIAYTPGILNSKDTLKDTINNTLDPQISKVIGYLFPSF
ncbi:hypothetical protein cand_002070 [Cryptosporidium andersoni]|uniref:START domain-containing protein n=1 Tax=Cryptosporidium andersoni TaxID=117008 RepID=A0A1J4MQW1_9CRYT|nr:hypothetical protein cand_002070 [Cryptosporidium andersoni]